MKFRQTGCHLSYLISLEFGILLRKSPDNAIKKDKTGNGIIKKNLQTTVTLNRHILIPAGNSNRNSHIIHFDFGESTN